MDRRLLAATALAVVLLAAGCTVGYQPAADAPPTSEPPAEPHPGYYDGYWYNDTFDLDAEAGLTDPQVDAVTARAMARVQLLRGLEFESDVDVELLTREAFQAEYGDVWGDPPADAQTLDNVQHEALFLVESDEDVVDARAVNRGDTVLGFYQPTTERLVVVSENDPATFDDEMTLAHELLHALQDQHFGLEDAGDGTLDGVNARNGLIEGDAVVIETEYEARCETGEWQCLETDDDSGTVGVPEEFNWGLYVLDFFPYAAGPPFIDHHRERGGWSAIDAAYDAPPTASAEVIYPETYGSGTYGEARIEDRPRNGWQRVTVDNGTDHARVGQVGLVAMFARTAYDDRASGVVPHTAVTGDDARYTYDLEYADGWTGDRLHAYQRDNETAYRWSVTFDDADEAATFRRGYERVLDYWGGEETADGHWRFDGEAGFEKTVSVSDTDASVRIVGAPTPEAVRDVSPAAAPNA